jgi:hypothetical protein
MPEPEVNATVTEGGGSVTAEPVALVNADGSFSEKWKESLDQSIQGEVMLDNLGDFHGLMKQFVHAQKNIGKDKIVLPNDKSTDNDWDEFYRATGRPDTPDKYNFVKDEAIAEHYDDAMLSKFMEGAHKVGLNQKHMDFLNAFENERIKNGLASVQAQKEKYLRELQEASDAKWGTAKEQRIHLGNMFINENTEEGPDRELLLEAMGNVGSELQIVISDVFASAAKKYIAEHVAIAGQMNAKTPKEAIAEAEKLRATEGYMDGTLKSKNLARYNEITQQIQALYKIAYPE